METSSALHASATLFPLNRRLGRHWNWSGQYGEGGKKLLALPGFIPQIIHTVA